MLNRLYTNYIFLCLSQGTCILRCWCLVLHLYNETLKDVLLHCDLLYPWLSNNCTLVMNVCHYHVSKTLHLMNLDSVYSYPMHKTCIKVYKWSHLEQYDGLISFYHTTNTNK